MHAPFYVYAYAFGDLLVRGLMEKRREDPETFAPLYEELLAAGGTKTYVEALAPFGLNPREKAFWAAGCAQLERLVDEFEALGLSPVGRGRPPPGRGGAPRWGLACPRLIPPTPNATASPAACGAWPRSGAGLAGRRRGVRRQPAVRRRRHRRPQRHAR